MMKIAVYGKGGIGKSTMSANITAALSDSGLKVLQIGCDPKHDSTRLLLNGELPVTILEYLKDTPEAERSLDDVISVGYKGCLCAESGGPEPGVGCAGRGIISAFNLLTSLGIDTVEKDITLYDVLGDVVCGGFAVPIRNEYADRIFIVSSGEFMSIYAANNILKGVGNYNPDRIGGIIFNSRGGPEEPGRIKRFSEAVGIPIVATFDRSTLFAEAEEHGKTVVEMFPDSKETGSFRALGRLLTEGQLYTAKHLSESELENVVLGRSITKPKSDTTRVVFAQKESPKKERRYTSRNVDNHDPYTGCAFAGAQSVCASIPNMATVLHSPLNCAQFAFQMVSSSARRAHMFGSLPVANFIDPEVCCTAMTEDDMVFGAAKKLKEMLKTQISNGYDKIAVVTSCASGIIGDNVKDTITEVENENPGVKIALVEEDGDINGDFMQGVIDAGVALSRRFSIEVEKTDSVNIIGTKTISTNCMETESIVRTALHALGLTVNCAYPGCGGISDIERLRAAKYNILLNPDRFTKQLAQQLEDDFGIPCLDHMIRPGLTGMREWLGEVAEKFGRQKQFEEYMKKVEKEFDRRMAMLPPVLKGKKTRIIAITKDVDWLLEGARSAGMIVESAVVVDRSDYCNDSDLVSKYPMVRVIQSDDLRAEGEEIIRTRPDIIFTSARLPSDIVQLPIPMVQEDDPFYAIKFFTDAARKLMAPAEAGWRRDVVRS